MKGKTAAVGILDPGTPKVFIDGELLFERGLEALQKQDVCTRLILQYKGEEVLDQVALDPRQDLYGLRALEHEWEDLWWLVDQSARNDDEFEE